VVAGTGAETHGCAETVRASAFQYDGIAFLMTRYKAVWNGLHGTPITVSSSDNIFFWGHVRGHLTDMSGN
jgi:hypothetical protein